MIYYKCAHCGVALETDDDLGGKEEPCPECGKINTAPMSKKAQAEKERQDRENLRRQEEERRRKELYEQSAAKICEERKKDPLAYEGRQKELYENRAAGQERRRALAEVREARALPGSIFATSDTNINPVRKGGPGPIIVLLITIAIGSFGLLCYTSKNPGQRMGSTAAQQNGPAQQDGHGSAVHIMTMDKNGRFTDRPATEEESRAMNKALAPPTALHVYMNGKWYTRGEDGKYYDPDSPLERLNPRPRPEVENPLNRKPKNY